MTTAELEPLALIDHHVHGVVTAELDRAGFEYLISEASGPPAPGTSTAPYAPPSLPATTGSAPSANQVKTFIQP